MSVYRDLLAELGIQVAPDFESYFPKTPPPPQPELINENVEKQFLRFLDDHSHANLDVNGYAVPRDYTPKPTHRYIREERFRRTISTFISGDERRLKKYHRYSYEQRSDGFLQLFHHLDIRDYNIYNNIRHILKQHRLRPLYIQIPRIIHRLGGPPLKIDTKTMAQLLADYTQMHVNFNNTPGGGTYFPNFRAVIITLLLKNGVTFPYDIPVSPSPTKAWKLQSEVLSLLQTPV